jgi:hypothetical protein
MLKMPNKRQMVDREDEIFSSPNFEELEVRPNLADFEICGVVG